MYKRLPIKLVRNTDNLIRCLQISTHFHVKQNVAGIISNTNWWGLLWNRKTKAMQREMFMCFNIVAQADNFVHIVFWLNLSIAVSICLPSDKHNGASTFALSPGMTPTMVSLWQLEKL